MAILINDTAPRAQYTATSGQTVFTVSFEFFANSDLKVYRNATLLTLTTNYTVTGAGVTGGGSVTLVTGATAGDIVTIIRDVPVARTSDFPTSGPFNIEALNTDLDRLTAMIQEREQGLTRVVQLSETDTSTSLQLPIAANRASKVLGFDATGNAIVMQEIGNYRGNWATSTAFVLRDLVKDSSNNNIYICVVAHTSTGSTPISSNADVAKWALLVDAATATSASSSASTSATNAAASASAASSSASSASGSASSASTSASNAASAQAAAESARDATLAAYDNFDDRYLGAKTSDPTLDNDGNALVAGALYFNSTDGVMKLYTGSSWVAAYVSGAGFLALSGGTMTGTVNVVAGSVSAPGIAASGNTNTGIFFPAADTIAFAEGGVESMRINSAGQVGIGTGSSALTKALTVQASEPMIQLIDSDSPTRVANIGGQNGNVTIDIDPAAGAASSVFAVNIDAAERFRIAALGQIGIGGANYGTSGQVLTSGGSGAAPSWAAPATSVINVQPFDSSGVWTKPSGYSASSRVLVQCWGGGGSGARQSTAGSCGGGGGGGYNERWLTLSQMGATETITIGAGGASRTGSNQAGAQGGDTSVGSLVFGYGGAGSPLTASGGGGGGQLSAGSAGDAGRPYFATDSGGTSERQGAGASNASTFGKNDALFHGGGGGFGIAALSSASSSVWGGGGGGGGNATAAPGTSAYGGNGGAGGATGAAGTQPGGGGGGGTTTSGAGGAGRVIITVFPA